MPAEGEPKVHCVRNGTDKPCDEHLACPYCFGKSRDVIEAGDRRRFCDYDPERDSVSFGFPAESSRHRRG